MSPLDTWFADERAVGRFRRLWLARRPVTLRARDRGWRRLAPGFDEAVALARSGVPFQIAADQRYDRSGDPGRLDPALASGATVFLPQVHELLPRLARLMVALRHAFFGPFREESSFLFIVEGTGRPGMGLHHDGEVDSFWLQLNGRRTVTIGPPVAPGTPSDLDGQLADHALRARSARESPGPARWWTALLEPGTLLHLPPRTPHRVVCRGRSLAVTLTWGGRTRRRSLRVSSRTRAVALATWPVTSGYVDALPPSSRERVFVQVPAIPGDVDAIGRVWLWTGDGRGVRVPPRPPRVLGSLGRMPSLPREAAGSLLGPLLDAGILGPRDLPLRILADNPSGLDGWRFA